MDSFTALAKEIQELKDPAKLKQKSRELANLRSRIDQAAPEMLEKSQQARAKKQEYMQAVTSNSPAQR